MSNEPKNYHTYNEILSQPLALRAVLNSMQAAAADFKGRWAAEAGQEQIFTACGSPFYLSQSAAMIYAGKTGATARAYPASDILNFPDLTLRGKPRLLVATSRSGETSETVQAVEIFRQQSGKPAVAVVCSPDTSLAKAASAAYFLPETEEVSLAQTKTFSAMLLAVQYLIHSLANDGSVEALYRLPDLIEQVLPQCLPVAQSLGSDPSFERFFFLGGGPFYGLACEGMLKIKEMSISHSEAYHFMEFRHGPMSMVNQRTLIVGLVSEAATAREAAVLAEMRAIGARVLALTPRRLDAKAADWQIVLPGGLDDLQRGPLYLPAMQLLGFFRAVGKGLNPDKPENLKKFVQLDDLS